MFAVVIVSRCLLCLSVFMRHVFPAPNRPPPPNLPPSSGGIYLQWQVGDASAGARDFSANHVNPSP